MHQSLLRAATTATRQGLGSKSALALLPPISLYRRLLRAHRKHLPAEMRILGDEYIKAEFRAHRNIDNPAHLVRRCSIYWDQCSDSIQNLSCRTLLTPCPCLLFMQIGFLTEWQLYAQKIEGDSWKGEMIDEGKLSKLSGTSAPQYHSPASLR